MGSNLATRNMRKDSRIYIAGHKGMVGSAITRYLTEQGYRSILCAQKGAFDLRSQSDVAKLFDSFRPEYVFLAAAKVGGIIANNTYRADFIYDNITIETNVIHQAYKSGVKRLI